MFSPLNILALVIFILGWFLIGSWKPWNNLGFILVGAVLIPIDFLNPEHAVYGGPTCVGAVFVLWGLMQFVPDFMEWYRDRKRIRELEGMVFTGYDRWGRKMGSFVIRSNRKK